jgi:hypothetical protein
MSAFVNDLLANVNYNKPQLERSEVLTAASMKMAVFFRLLYLVVW